MASAPQLPLFYNTLEPLSSDAHGNFHARNIDKAPFLANQHAIPVTVEEFPQLMRFMPIVFTSGDDPIPLALMGLNEGVNAFVDSDGTLLETHIYVPAYIRRYPYLLARLNPDAQELTLCFDPTADAIGAFDDGEPLFEGDQPTATTKAILEFAQQFEEAGARTQSFMAELKELGLLREGECEIRTAPDAPPVIYRGFQMVDEEKFNDLRGDQLRKLMKSGFVAMVFAHLFSMQRMSEIFSRQVQRGLTPPPQLAPAAANA